MILGSTLNEEKRNKDQIARHEDTNVSIDTKKDSSRFECELCDKLYGKKSSFDHHKENYHSIGTFVCGFCPRRFMKKSMLDSHEDHCQLDTPKINAFECNLCFIQFDQINRLREHLDLFHKFKKYKCSQCAARFSGPMLLSKHIKICLSQTSQGKDSFCNLLSFLFLFIRFDNVFVM